MKFTDINILSAEILACTVQSLAQYAVFGQVAGDQLVIQTVDLGDFESSAQNSVQDNYPTLAGVSLSDSPFKDSL